MPWYAATAMCAASARCLWWKRHAFDQRRRQFGHSRSHVKQRQIRHQCRPTLSRIRIAGQDLGEHHLRDVQIEGRSPLFPPGMRQLLPSRHNDVTTRPAGQVANKRGESVDRRAKIHPATRSSEAFTVARVTEALKWWALQDSNL
jgi:hypothetical protein